MVLCIWMLRNQADGKVSLDLGRKGVEGKLVKASGPAFGTLTLLGLGGGAGLLLASRGWQSFSCFKDKKVVIV